MERLVDFCKNPESYFSKVKKEGFKEAFWFYLIITLISSILGTAAFLKSYHLGMQWYPLGYVLFIVFMLTSFFIVTSLTQVALRMLNGHATYQDTVKAYVYGSIPTFLWSIPSDALMILFAQNKWVLILNAIISAGIILYAIYLTILGLSLYHKISKWRAFAGYSIPLLVLIAVAILLIFIFTIIMVLVSTIGGI